MPINMASCWCQPKSLRKFPKPPNAKALREAIAQQITDDLYHTDIHGKPLWRKHMSLRLAEEIRDELLGTPPS